MMRYQYHVVPFIGQIKGGKFSNANAQTVSKQLQDVIGRTVERGWEFYSIEKVGIEVQPGCLGVFIGGKSSYVNFDQIIFRQPVDR